MTAEPADPAPADEPRNTTDAASARARRALAALHGLRVGDALGAQFFVPAHLSLLRRAEVPPPPWSWTDDTEMACSVLAGLLTRGAVDQDDLARSFAAHHDFDRGYGPAAGRMLRLIRQEGGDWRELSAGLFHGSGSYGNGAAMRVAPLGAWYAGDPERAAAEAARSAEVTHRHPEGVAGAVAVALAAAAVAGGERDPRALLGAVLKGTPDSAVRAGVRRAAGLLDYRDVGTVAAVLGNGRNVTAQDTVPFAVWAAARHRGDFPGTVWACVRAGGDIDTTCAIAGGIVASAPEGAPPPDWLAATEPLPDWLPPLP
ncbi:ADP-ribosylglycohydrolase family protein [Streptomyces sp. YIM 98790]|uniref:ADP-ribosylglycohydrolase family protein n=1 Tax=Streptomyces sp. YIM 98790 TaxID=2689077 RepID=UPI00140B5E98|nr:ADP-ribosylglycohydrolase family protein [Streptomyces sp. YIM 98790]